jgi:signal transduction histidine kinase
MMRRITAWSEWSIATKIIVPFLGIFVVSMAVIGYIALTNIRGLGNYALDSSTSLGKTAIQDSTAHLKKLGEDTITQIAKDVAKQAEMYVATRPPMTMEEMRNDLLLREIVVQPVGKTGYTTLIDPEKSVIIIHKFPGQEKDVSPLKSLLPSFWSLMEASKGDGVVSGYYDWMEVNGSIQQKYASIVPIKNPNGDVLTLWATTYIDEFSMPVEETEKEINAAIFESGNYISDNVSRMQDFFIIIFTALFIFVIGLALLLSHVITSPILALKKGAEAIGHGELDYKLKLKNKDEIGDLANSFNKMGSDLKSYTEELKTTATENIAKEKKIQDNLRLYVQKVSQAQEAERKRVARELHDETAQALVVVLRHLDDLASVNSNLKAKDIRDEVKKILEGVRHFSQELRPSVLDDLGLIPALQWLASDLSKNFGITVETEIKGSQRQLPPEPELMLFRIAQEALTNVRKHSQATKAVVRIDFSDHEIKLTVQDNGKGFKIPSGVGDLTRLGKLGLAGMEERAQLLGGRLTIQSQPGKGTALTVEVPL